MLYNYDDFNDYELLMMVQENNEDAKDILYNKYSYLIGTIIKKYIAIAKKMGIDYKDMYQEAMLGFASAIDSYNDDKNTTLNTFISMCIERRLNTLVVHYSTQKHKIENETLSIDYVYDSYEATLAEIISDNNANDPLNKIQEKERVKNIINLLEKKLSIQEKQVYNLLLDGLNYNQISTILDKSPKSIDNSIQRIKYKLKNILDELNK